MTPPPGPRNLSLLVANRLTLRGFLVGDHTDLRPEFVETVSGWLRSGELVVRETVREGLEDAVPAFLDLLRGGNTGKMVVRLAPDAGLNGGSGARSAGQSLSHVALPHPPAAHVADPDRPRPLRDRRAAHGSAGGSSGATAPRR